MPLMVWVKRACLENLRNSLHRNSRGGGESENRRAKILYYNAYTEDLFYWDNDLEGGSERRLKIQPNAYTQWVLQEQGKDREAIGHFQRYTNEKLTPKFNEDFSEVTFSYTRGNDEERIDHIKISKGEESNFIWSIFYSLIEQVIDVLNVVDSEERETDQFDQLEYIFIDDPVSSLDENHLIELAVDLAQLIKTSGSSVKFIITTHNPFFYNVLYNELKSKTAYLLDRSEAGSFALLEKNGDSNKSFSYHLYLKQVLEEAIGNNKVERYHFTLLRNLYEKTASFLGYPNWSDILPADKQTYANRIIQFTSHSTLSNETVAELTTPEKRMVKLLLDNLINNYAYWQEPKS